MQRLFAILLCLIATAVCDAAAPAQRRPNILFIYADDQSAKTVSCYERAYPLARTPHIDALATAGVRFQGAYLGSWEELHRCNADFIRLLDPAGAAK